jgi:hypothetical protein
MLSPAITMAFIAQEEIPNIVSNNNAIILALIGLVSTSIAALVYTIKNGKISQEGVDQITAVNNAVNNVGPGEHRLYDMLALVRKDIEYLTIAQREFASKGWGSLPPDLNNAIGLTEVIRDLQHSDKEVILKLTEIKTALIEHTEWEMKQKYVNPDASMPPKF